MDVQKFTVDRNQVVSNVPRDESTSPSAFTAENRSGDETTIVSVSKLNLWHNWLVHANAKLLKSL